MASVMIQTTMKLAFLTVEIAVDLMSIQFGAQNAYALKNEYGHTKTSFGR